MSDKFANFIFMLVLFLLKKEPLGMQKIIRLWPMSLCILLAACGGGGGGGDTVAIVTTQVSGKITFDFVPATVAAGGAAKLDYANTVRRPARSVVVEAVDASSSTVLASTNSDATGNYALTVSGPSRLTFIRAKAKMAVSGTNVADISVVDNTQSGAQWAVAGSLFTITSAPVTQDLNASSGWTGASYDNTTRIAGPFAILDTIYQATQKVIAVDPSITFPKLNINWSPNNITTNGSIASGQIGVSFFDPTPPTLVAGVPTARNLYVLGFANNDTDEYDAHVVAHEFGHYLQAVFSRDDTMGGSHGGTNDRLDMRIAFSEGWGNAWASLVLNDTVYKDTRGASQANGFSQDIILGEATNPGWFKEFSVSKIFWDLGNSSAVGFGPIWNTLKSGLTTTPALTGIHAFAYALVNGIPVASRPAASAAVGSILANQSIALPSSPYAVNETNFGSPAITDTNPIYLSYVALNSTLGAICVNNLADPLRTTSRAVGNKAGEFRYVRLTLPASGNRVFTLTRTSSTTAITDPDFVIYNNTGSYLEAGSGTPNIETLNVLGMPAGDYVIEIRDFNNSFNTTNANACFSLTVS